MADEKEDKVLLVLDGSNGIGVMVELSIITADKVHGSKEVTYQFPYALLNTENLNLLRTAVDSGYILGYTVLKVIPPDAKSLVITNNGLRMEE